MRASLGPGLVLALLVGALGCGALGFGALGCGGQTPTAASTTPSETTALWSASSLDVGAASAITLQLRAGAGGVPAGAELRVGFPHWVYGSQGVVRPREAASEQFGHWYLTRELEAGIAPGEVLEWALPEITLPRTAGGFAPLVLLDWVRVPADERTLRPEAATELVVVGPSWVAPGGRTRVGVRVQDRFGNPAAVEQRTLDVPTEPGVHRLPFAEDGWTGTTQPLLVAPLEPGIGQVAWVDLHGHSGLSDGRGTPEEWFSAARAQLLDGAALTDHDWQLTDAEWAELLAATEAANEPGRFVTLAGAEINVHGHEIAYFADVARLGGIPAKGSRDGARTIWKETDRGLPTAKVPDLLGMYAGGRDGGAGLLVATHTSLAPGMGTGYPLPRPLPGNGAFEIYSAHGSSECAECPRRVGGGPLAADEAVGSLWDALDAGLDVTLIAASDAHDGRPATANWGAWPGGLTAVEVPELTRAAVFAALVDGRAWATTGERTLLRVRWRAHAVEVLVVGEGVEAVEVVGDRAVVGRRESPPQGRWFTLDGLPENAWRYVRVVLPDGARAWRGVWRPETTAPGRRTR